MEDYLIEKYGDQKIKDAIKTVRNLDQVDKLFWNQKELSKSDRKFVEKVKETKAKGDSIVNDFFNNSLFKNEKINADTLASFKKLGYDAIVDVEDASMASLPLILIDPKSFIKNSVSRKLYN